MCMRFAFTPLNVNDVMGRYDLESIDHELKPRYNISPSQKVPVVYNDSPKMLSTAVWGIPTHWKGVDEKLLLNARGETIDQKPSFKKDFQLNRCLMLADSFYEWKKPEKRPFRISLKKGMFAFAAIYSKGKDGERSCCMITTGTNELVSQIHDRMPAILPLKREKDWLSLAPEEAKTLIKPFPAGEMEMVEISRKINSSKIDNPGVVEPKSSKESLLEYMG